jgi:hypothetical protein
MRVEPGKLELVRFATLAANSDNTQVFHQGKLNFNCTGLRTALSNC